MPSKSLEANQDIIDEIVAALAVVPSRHPRRTEVARALGIGTNQLSVKAVREGRIPVTPHALAELRSIIKTLRERKDEILSATTITPGLYQYPNGTGKRVQVTSVEHGQVSYVLDGTTIGFQMSAADFAQKYVRA